MKRRSGLRSPGSLATALTASCALLALNALVACSGTDSGPKGSSNKGGSTGSGGANAGGAGGGASGSGGSPGSGGSSSGGGSSGAAGAGGSGGAAGAAGSGGAPAGGTGGTTGADAGADTAADTGGSMPSAMGKIPMCITSNVMDGVNRATTNYIECDVEEQAIDFDVAANYAMNRKPGYDPAMTPITFTNFGKAFTGWEVQMCHPYCYKGNLTVGVDFVPGSAEGLQGEVLFDFPATTVAPIPNASGRLSLGWIYLDGPALPAGVDIQSQMVLKTQGKGVVLGKGLLALPLKKWVEFKYFPIQQGFGPEDLVNVTAIGFRVTMATATAKEWHGVIYADHFQLRK